MTWGRVTVKLSTHSAGGITDKDFALARKIEDVVLWRPAEGDALEGTPNKFVRSGDPRVMNPARARARRSRLSVACCSSPAGSPSPRCGACSPTWRRRFAYDVAVLKITVAALMTTAWIARHLLGRAGRHRPGADSRACARAIRRSIWREVGVRVEKGPKDLREIPRHFGRAAAAREYGAWDIEIVAEINNAPRLTREAIRREADYFRASGADIIDIGCTPGLPFPALGDVVRELVAAGMRVSVDTFDPDEIRTAVAAGAELVLSVNGSNIDVARDSPARGARVVVVPDLGGTLETLEPTLDKLQAWGVPYLIDPILEPIGYGIHGVARTVRGSAAAVSRRPRC